MARSRTTGTRSTSFEFQHAAADLLGAEATVYFDRALLSRHVSPDLIVVATHQLIRTTSMAGPYRNAVQNAPLTDSYGNFGYAYFPRQLQRTQ